MTATIDAYHAWLGIPPAEHPPHHYRLLGLPLFETDLSVIGNAADRQSVYVKTFLSGQHAKTAERLLAEIGTARMCLFDAQRRGEYDAKLRDRLAKAAAVAAPAAAATDSSAGPAYARPAPRAAAGSSAAVMEAEPVAPPPPPRAAKVKPSVASVKSKRAAAPPATAYVLLGAGALGTLVVVAGVVFALQSAFSRKQKPKEEIAKGDKTKEPTLVVKKQDRVRPSNPQGPEILEKTREPNVPLPEVVDFGKTKDESITTPDLDKRNDPRLAPFPSVPGSELDGLGSISPTSPIVNGFGSAGDLQGTSKDLAAARTALEMRDYKAARELLAKAKGLKLNIIVTAKVVHLETVGKYVENFWVAVRKTAGEIPLGEKLTLDGEEYELLSRNAETISFKVGGVVKSSKILELDARAAAAFALRGLPAGDPNSKVYVGTFLALDQQGGIASREWQSALARKLWEEAAGEGAKDPILAEELDIDLNGSVKRGKGPKSSR